MNLDDIIRQASLQTGKDIDEVFTSADFRKLGEHIISLSNELKNNMFIIDTAHFLLREDFPFVEETPYHNTMIHLAKKDSTVKAMRLEKAGDHYMTIDYSVCTVTKDIDAETLGRVIMRDMVRELDKEFLPTPKKEEHISKDDDDYER